MTAPSAVLPATVRVLGIDPGTRILGYGILDVSTGREPILVARGAIRLPLRPLAERLHLIFREVEAILATHTPQVLAIEQVFYGKNFQSVLKVGEARGVVVLAAQISGLEICEYAPAKIKKAATGNGNADKLQVQKMMCRVLGLAEAPKFADVTDALAAAYCHGQLLWRQRLHLGGTKRKALKLLAGEGVAGKSLLGEERVAKEQVGRRNRSAATTWRVRQGGKPAASLSFDLEALLKGGKARLFSGVRWRKAIQKVGRQP